MNKKHFVLGGDLKKSLTEGYQLDLKALFKDALMITRKNYFPLIVACIFTIAILAGSYGLIYGPVQLGDNSETPMMILNYVITLVIAPPLIAGLQMMGVHHSIGLKTKTVDVFNYFNLIFKLAIATLSISLLTNVVSLALTTALGTLGTQLSIIALLYINMVFSLVYMLIAEKKVTAQLALQLSFKLVHKNLRQFTFLFVLISFLFILALLPSGFGLFIFIPFYFNLMGLVYRQLCGVGIVATEVNEDDDTPPSSNNGSDFEA